METGTIQGTDQVRNIGRVRERRQCRLWHGRLRHGHGLHLRNAKSWIRSKGNWDRAPLHCLSLVKHKLGGNVRFNFRVVAEADVGWSGTSVKDLKRDFSGELVRSRQPDNSKNTFNILTVDCSTERNARAEHKHVYAQTTIAKSIFNMKDEVTIHFF